MLVCAFCYTHFAHETAGAARTRSSLRPLCFGRNDLKTSGAACRENAEVCFLPSPGGVRDERSSLVGRLILSVAKCETGWGGVTRSGASAIIIRSAATPPPRYRTTLRVAGARRPSPSRGGCSEAPAQATLSRNASSAASTASGVPTCIQTPSSRSPNSRSCSLAWSNIFVSENSPAGAAANKDGDMIAAPA